MLNRNPRSATEVRREKLVLACVCACTALVIGFVAAINLAVPKLAASTLHPSSAQVLWVVDAYVIVFACLVIPAGAAGDRFGRKGLLLTGLAALAGGAGVSAVAGDVTTMLAGRGLAGLGAALVLPSCVAVLLHATAPARRSRALAAWAAATGIGGVLGNVGGGALLGVGSWRLLFWAVVALAALCAGWVGLVAPRAPRHPRDLDLRGTALFVATILALLTGIIEGPQHGWGSGVVVAAFALCAVLGVLWTCAELRVRQPMLDPRLFQNLALATASTGMLVTFFGSFGLFYVNASLLQYGRGFSILRAGLGILPLTLPLLIGTRYVPGLVQRFGLPLVLGVAFGATAGGLLGLSFASRAPYVVYGSWLVVIGVGIMLAGPTLTSEIARALPPERAGTAGGLQAATRELGSALGVAVVGTALTSAFTRHLPLGLAGRSAHTVAEALAAAPTQSEAIDQAFVVGADSALRIASTVTLIVGSLVVASAAHGRRRQQR